MFPTTSSCSEPIFLKNEYGTTPFAANAETGLKPILAGYDIEEVPISWINRDMDMGQSTFGVAKVAPGYFKALMGLIWKNLGTSRPARSRIKRCHDQFVSSFNFHNLTSYAFMLSIGHQGLWRVFSQS